MPLSLRTAKISRSQVGNTPMARSGIFSCKSRLRDKPFETILPDCQNRSHISSCPPGLPGRCRRAPNPATHGDVQLRLARERDAIEETQTDDVRNVDTLGSRCDRELDRFVHEWSYPCEFCGYRGFPASVIEPALGGGARVILRLRILHVKRIRSQSAICFHWFVLPMIHSRVIPSDTDLFQSRNAPRSFESAAASISRQERSRVEPSGRGRGFWPRISTPESIYRILIAPQWMVTR